MVYHFLLELCIKYKTRENQFFVSSEKIITYNRGSIIYICATLACVIFIKTRSQTSRSSRETFSAIDRYTLLIMIYSCAPSRARHSTHDNKVFERVLPRAVYRSVCSVCSRSGVEGGDCARGAHSVTGSSAD